MNKHKKGRNANIYLHARISNLFIGRVNLKEIGDPLKCSIEKKKKK